MAPRLSRSLAAGILAVLLAACGGDGTTTVTDVTTSTTVPGVVDAAVTTLVGSGPAPTGGAGGDVDAPPAPVDPAPGDIPPPDVPAGGAPGLDANVDVGAFAPALLRPDLSSRLVIESHGAPASSAALEHVRSTLAGASGKDVTVTVAAAPPARAEWTASTLIAAADAGAQVAQGRGTAVIRLLFVRGTFEGDGGVLGVAVRGDIAAIFLDRVAAQGGLLGGSERIETAVTLHEVGHLLGLVDLYLATGRADPEHPGHSANPDSVMYWAVESDALGALFGANPPTTFDAADRADLAAIAAGA